MEPICPTNEIEAGRWPLDGPCPRTFQGRVPASWREPGGPLRPMNSILVLAQAATNWFDYCGVGDSLRARGPGAMFAVHSRMDFDPQATLDVGDGIRVNSRLVGLDPKRLVHMQILCRVGDDTPLVVLQILALHVDTGGPRSAPFPADIYAGLETIWAVHRTLPRPALAGDAIQPISMVPA